MKTKIIPFDLEKAKKIQSGEIEGKIKTKGGFNVRIVTFDMDNESYQIVALIRDTVAKNQEYVITYTKYGYRYNSRVRTLDDLILEIPDNEPQFKPFDKVLVRNDINSIWQPSIFSYQLGDCYYTVSSYPYNKENIIPYAGNEHLVGTTDKPKET